MYGVQINGSLGFGKTGINPTIRIVNSNCFCERTRYKNQASTYTGIRLVGLSGIKKGIYGISNLSIQSDVVVQERFMIQEFL